MLFVSLPQASHYVHFVACLVCCLAESQLQIALKTAKTLDRKEIKSLASSILFKVMMTLHTVINIITVTPEIGQEQHDKWIR